MMNSMLEQTLAIGTGKKADLPGWEAAGKTGTSQDYRDAWFVGYTSQLITGVWIGNDDNSPTKKASGANLPVEIWSRFMREALKGMVVAGLPSGGWRSESLTGGPAASLWPQAAPPAEAPRAAAVHMDTSNPGLPVVINGPGRVVTEAPERDEEPTPPENIPNGPPGRRPRQAADNGNIFQQLFGR